MAIKIKATSESITEVAYNKFRFDGVFVVLGRTGNKREPNKEQRFVMYRDELGMSKYRRYSDGKKIMFIYEGVKIKKLTPEQVIQFEKRVSRL